MNQRYTRSLVIEFKVTLFEFRLVLGLGLARVP